MSKKLDFAKRCLEIATQLALARDQIATLGRVYGDRAYAVADAITDADVDSLGITAAQLTALLALAAQFNRLMANQAVTTINGDATVNVLRTDQ